MASVQSLAIGLLGAAACGGVAQMMWRKSRHGHGSSPPMIYPIMLFAFAIFLAMGSVKAFFKGPSAADQSNVSAPAPMDAPSQYASPPAVATENPYAKTAR